MLEELEYVVGDTSSEAQRPEASASTWTLPRGGQMQ